MVLMLIFIVPLISSTERIFSANDIDASALSAFNETAFVLAWCDGDLEDIVFQTFNTNGENLSQQITVDSEVGGCFEEGQPVTVSTFNETTFVIGWFDDTDVNDEDARFRTYMINGSSISGEVEVDDDMGNGATIDVKTLNSSQFVLSYIDAGNTTETSRYGVFDINGNNISDLVTVSDMAIGSSRQSRIVVFNETSWGIVYIDATAGDLTYNLYNNDIAEISNFDIDITAGSREEVAVATYNESSFVVAFNDQSGVVFETLQSNGTKISEQVLITTSSTASINIDVAVINSTHHIVFYTANTPATATYAALYQKNGTLISGPTEFALNHDNIAIVSTNFQSTNSICDGSFVWAGSPSASEAAWKTNYTGNFSDWDGLCPSIAEIIS